MTVVNSLDDQMKLTFSPIEREVLRALAGRVGELAARPIEQEKRSLWLRHNALQSERPLIFCDPENGWHEIITSGDLRCEHPLARDWEMALRKEIFWAEEMRDDRVIAPYFSVAHAWKDTGWGMPMRRIGGDDGGAYTWDAPLKDYADFDRLRVPQIVVDEAASAARLALAEEMFGDLLAVRQRTPWLWTVGLTWTLVDLRGMEQMMLDMLDGPDNLHRLMALLRDAMHARLDFLEQHGLFSANNDDAYVGSGGFGWSDELAQPASGEPIQCAHRWGFAESQETVGVSPRMFAEFVFPYQLPLLERFGLNCYGCCEPLDARWEIVQQVPRLRRVSVSPWSDRARMAEFLGDAYVFSMKPHPNMVAGPTFDEDRVRADLRRDLRLTRGCHVEVILKDTHTIGRDPRRVTRWVEIARQEIEAL